MQPQTTMLPPPCLTLSKAQFSWYSSPGRHHTCWTPSEPNKFTLDSSDHRHGSSNSCSWSGCLQQTICRLFLWASFRRGFLLGQRPCKPTCCSVWRMVWAPTSWASTSATLKQCWQHSCICFWSQLLHLTHSTRTQLLWSTLARPVPSENHFGKPLYDHGHSTVTQYQVVTELLISYAIFVESNNSNSQILREFFAMRCHVEHPVASMRELYSKNQIWPALNKIHKFVCLFSKHMNMMNRTCGFACLNNV